MSALGTVDSRDFLQYSTIEDLYNTVKYSTIKYSTIDDLYNTVKYSTIEYRTVKTLQESTVVYRLYKVQ